MKNTAKLKFLFFFLFIGLFSCEQNLFYEEVTETSDGLIEAQDGPKLKYITDSSIPDIMSDLTSRGPKDRMEQTKGKLSYNEVDIDLEAIMEVVATGSETNYTFGLDVKNAPEHHLYNLIMGKDANGNLREPYVVGYEMDPDAMTEFLESGEDFGQFRAHFRYYTFDGFFADSKLNRIGKNGDCGDGTIGGSGSSETPAGGTFTHTYNGLTITNIFGPNAVQIPYGYSVSITGSDGSTSTATTNTMAPVSIITAGVASTGSTTVVPNPPNSSITTYTTHVNFGVSSEGVGPSGPGITCYYTITTIGNVSITETNCVENSQKYYGKSGKNGDCPNTDGATGISTAGRPVLQLIGYLGSNFMKSRKTFLKGNKAIAQIIVNFIADNNVSGEAKEFAKKAIDAMMEGASVNFDEQIINSIDNPCAAAVVNEANKMDNEITRSLKKSFGDDESPDLVYLNGHVEQADEGTTLAHTQPLTDNNGKVFAINITFNDDYLDNATDLSIFSTTIHENIHAYMYAQLSNAGITINDPNLDYSILADEWSKFVAERKRGVPEDDIKTNLVRAQHQIMGELVALNTEIILEYGLSKGYAIDDFKAEALAWAGLQSSVAWTLVNEDFKQTYENLIENDANFTGFEWLAIGQPCN